MAVNKKATPTVVEADTKPAAKAPGKTKAKSAVKATAKAPAKTEAKGKTAKPTPTPTPTKGKAGKAAATPVKKSAAGKAAEGAPVKKLAPPRRGNDNALVIVESPAKAKTIKKYLGAGYTVKASVGHVKDLPRKTLGIDIENGFQPEYVVIDGKKKVLAEIKEAAETASQIFLAPDPDREGEAIAWHIAEEIRPSNPNIHRVLFNEIT